MVFKKARPKLVIGEPGLYLFKRAEVYLPSVGDC
jgi:hypothetical protein